MTRQEIEDKVRTFLIDELEVDADKIAPEARLREDLGIDSLDLVDIVVIVDRYFGVRIQNEDIAQLTTLKEFYDYIERETKQ